VREPPPSCAACASPWCAASCPSVSPVAAAHWLHCWAWPARPAGETARPPAVASSTGACPPAAKGTGCQRATSCWWGLSYFSIEPEAGRRRGLWQVGGREPEQGETHHRGAALRRPLRNAGRASSLGAGRLLFGVQLGGLGGRVGGRWQLSTHGGGWQLSTHGGRWQLSAHGGGWQLSTHGGRWQLSAHGGRWQLSTHCGRWQLSAHCGRWQLSAHCGRWQLSTRRRRRRWGGG
jgi:hypothetical protein